MKEPRNLAPRDIKNRVRAVRELTHVSADHHVFGVALDFPQSARVAWLDVYKQYSSEFQDTCPDDLPDEVVDHLMRRWFRTMLARTLEQHDEGLIEHARRAGVWGETDEA